VLIPPSGHIAGVWARTDESRGVWKAPANDTMRGVLDIERTVTQNEQSLLNPLGINCIRPFGTRGIRIWGARTLSSDTDWRYINVRRLFNMIESTILEGTQYVVFEPNDVGTWEGVKRTLTSFLRGLWSAGALFGSSADQAFYVKCDAETNPPESIDQGKLVVEVGIAPVKPAEFVVFRISQQKQSAA
jgi:phage tail sheath protein FI